MQVVEEGQQIEAVVADAGLAHLLDVAIGAPVLLIRRMLRPPHDGSMVLVQAVLSCGSLLLHLELALWRRPGRLPPQRNRDDKHALNGGPAASQSCPSADRHRLQCARSQTKRGLSCAAVTRGCGAP
ncbi:MAG: hypothetical protein IPI03_18995 [Rubrivivax sp.]|nr:hypothetical protein [Rubrivivax sp.]